MLIDYHNYEEFFLLYADNELSASECRAVEAFLLQHPELKEELQTLTDMKLEPDTNITMPGKQSLYKQPLTAIAGIDEKNYPEFFLLYIDRELNTTDQQRTEDFLAKNPQLLPEFQQLQATILEPDTTVVFAGKSALYREEAQVVKIAWKKWAVAAAILLLLSVSITTLVRVNRNPDTIIAKSGNDQQQPAPVNNNSGKNTEAIAVVPARQQTTPVTKEENTAGTNIKSSITPTNSRKDNPVTENKLSPVTIAKSMNIVPINSSKEKEDETVRLAFADKGKAEKIINPETDINAGTQQVLNENTLAVSINPNAQFASFTEETSGKNQSGFGYALEEKSRKNGLRGFIRKATRGFNRNMTSDDPDRKKLLIGSFSIPLSK
jgi:hypothetical protein